MHSSKLEIIILLCCLLLSTTFAKWTAPVVVEDLDHEGRSVIVHNVYRDPVSSVSHAIVSDEEKGRYTHFAVSDEGKVIYSTRLKDSHSLGATIRGVGDGRHLFLAFWSTHPQSVKFAESVNGGKSWSDPAFILEASSTVRTFQDLIYVADTGRLFVFFSTSKGELRMVWRDRGEKKFSSEKFVAFSADDYDSARVAYSNNGAMFVVHSANDSRGIMVARSLDGGMSWESSRMLVKYKDSTKYRAMVNIAAADNGRVYVTYSISGKTARILFSENRGETFTQPISITDQKIMPNSYHGLAVCGPNVVTLFAVDGGYSEYAVWNATGMKKIRGKEDPFGMRSVKNVAVDCWALGNNAFVGAAFAIDYMRLNNKVYFALESEGSQ